MPNRVSTDSGRSRQFAGVKGGIASLHVSTLESIPMSRITFDSYDDGHADLDIPILKQRIGISLP
jgi:hypothetical protein